MKKHPLSFSQMFLCIWNQRDLIYVLSKRSVFARYRGSYLGMLWAFLNPVVMLLIYTFVFSYVFKARWGGNEHNAVDFGFIIFVGLIFFNMFSEVLLKSPALIKAEVNYVKKMIFPLEILPVVSVATVFFHGLLSFCVLIAGMLILQLDMHIHIIFIIPVLLAYVFLLLGVSWFFSALGAYLKDVSQLMTMFSTAMLFLSGVFFPVSSLPEQYRSILELNPLVHFIELGRLILLNGEVPETGQMLLMFVSSLLIAWIGFFGFQKARNGFSDVL